MGCRQALTVHQAQQLVALPQVHGVINGGVEVIHGLPHFTQRRLTHGLALLDGSAVSTLQGAAQFVFGREIHRRFDIGCPHEHADVLTKIRQLEGQTGIGLDQDSLGAIRDDQDHDVFFVRDLIADIEEPEKLESTEIDGLVTFEHQNRGTLQVFLKDGYEKAETHG